MKTITIFLAIFLSSLTKISFAQTTSGTPNVKSSTPTMVEVDAEKAWMAEVPDTVTLQYLSTRSVQNFTKTKDELSSDLIASGIEFRVVCYQYGSIYRFVIESWGDQRLKTKKIVNKKFNDAFFLDVQGQKRAEFNENVDLYLDEWYTHQDIQKRCFFSETLFSFQQTISIYFTSILALYKK